MSQNELKFPLGGKRVWIAGHKGMVGSAIARRLRRENCHIVTADRNSLDLRDQSAVRHWMADSRPDAIFLAAAKVGGIHANDILPVDFLYDNLMIETNIIEAAYRNNVAKLLFLGSSCIYPRMSPQPIKEEDLMTGPLEPTNEWYAIAKIAGIKLCQAYRKQFACDFISAMPTNLYGSGDNFDLQMSHVVPALIRKTHEAKMRGDKEIVIWGSGKPYRDFLHVDDCADACVHLMKFYSGGDHINVGTGQDITILELAELISRIVGFAGTVTFDRTKPDGTPRKLLSGDKLRALGWSAKLSLSDGLTATYGWYKDSLTQSAAFSKRNGD